MTEQNLEKTNSISIEDFFKEWWISSYGIPPGKHAVMTHVQFVQDFMETLRKNSEA